MKVSIKEGFIYTPFWNNNKEAKKKDQITVEFQFLRGCDIAEICDDTGKVDLKKDWLQICKSVNNLKVNNIDVTPEGVYEIQGLASLYLELKNAYKNESEIDKKKL
jgi:hypothetical protein